VDLPVGAYDRFWAYLELLLRWNQRLSLTSVRDPDQIILRHFVECAFVAGQLPQDIADLLDTAPVRGCREYPSQFVVRRFASPWQRPMAKKASFLREALRVLSLEGEVYDGRVETMPERRFDAVAMRAVEKMDLAIPFALQRVKRYIVLLTTERSGLARGTAMPGLEWLEPLSIPSTEQMVLEIGPAGIGCSTWNIGLFCTDFR